MYSKKIKLFINSFFCLVILYLIFQNILSFLEQTNYRHLHIDERQLLDSILNVFQIVDEFGRFKNVNEGIFKSFLIILSELIIGGNLDYGRFYTNMFIFLSLPFYFINFQILVFLTRLIQLTTFLITVIYIAKYFIKQNYKVFFVLLSLTIPGSYYLIQNPKPDLLSILFFFIFLRQMLFEKNIKYGFLFAGLAIGVKIISLIPFMIALFYFLFFEPKIQIKIILRNIKFLIFGLVISQPALLIPSKKIYLRIYNALKVGSNYDQAQFFTFSKEYFLSWIEVLSKEYSINSFLLFFIFISTTFIVILNIFKNPVRDFDTYYLLTFLGFSLFFMFNVQRTWSYYLFFPFIFLLIYLFNQDSYFSKYKLIVLFPFLIFSFNGLFFNAEKAINSDFLISEKSEKSFYEALNYLEMEYNQKSFKYGVVYWDPDFYFPRINLDYQSNFIVNENWEQEKKTAPLYSKVDFIISLEKFDQSNDVKVNKIGNLFIYSLNN